MAEIRTLVPLAVGKSVTFPHTGVDDKGADVTWNVTVSVEKYETAKTPAGSWPAFVILYAKDIIGGTGRWEQRWWYAPAIGYSPISQYRTARGHSPVRTPADSHLVEYVAK